MRLHFFNSAVTATSKMVYCHEGGHLFERAVVREKCLIKT